MAGRDSRAFHVVLGALYLLLAIALTWVLVVGANYYTTPLSQRPHHPDFRTLRPAGMIGHGLGIVGSAQLLLLLLYSVRKRWRRLRPLGRISRWLDVHIFLGVSGPLLVTLHTSFKIHGLVAVSYWSMVAVALSGVFGRYLYLQIPRNVLGEALSLDEILHQLAAADDRLRTVHGLRDEEVESLERHSVGCGLLAMPASNLLLARTLRKLLPSGTSVAGRRAARARILMRRRILFHDRIRELFHYWHVIHKPFAVLMLIIMAVHVGVAVALGYRWLF